MRGGARGTLLVAAMSAMCIWPSGQTAGRTDVAPVSNARAGPHLAWSDEFSGRGGRRPDRSKWRYDVGGHGWGNHELERYTRRRGNAHLDGRGHLVVTARHRARYGRDGVRRRFTSARLKTLGHFSFRYGRVAARMRVPAGRGLWPAFWMLGANIGRVGYPRCGEIDVMELLGQDPRKVYGTVHGPGLHLKQGIGGRFLAHRSLARHFHVYSVGWTPNYVRFRLDGHAYETVRRSAYPRRDTWAFDHRMFLLLNLAVGGWPGPPSHATHFPARLKVDWVRVWHTSRHSTG